MALQARKILDQFPSYKMARSLESIQREYGFEKIIKLAGNENSLGYSPLAKKAIENSLEGLSYYPDMFCTKLREKLAQKLNVDGNQLIFGAGSFSLISLVAETFIYPGEEAIMAEPSFGWYKMATLTADGKIISVPLKDYTVDLDAITEKITERTKIIWLCNPNNPTATQIAKRRFEQFLAEVRDGIIIVLDEAYIDFSDTSDTFSGLSYIGDHKNVIALRTFSKLYGLASFRVGYGIASPELISYMEKAQVPAGLSQLSQIAALASLDDEEFKARVLDNAKRSKELYYQTLDGLSLAYIKSNTNFIMFDTGSDSDYYVFELLKRGILVRGGKEFGMPTWLRVTIGTYEENQLVLDLIKELRNALKAQ